LGSVLHTVKRRTITFDLPQTLPPLSAAAEGAVYRIVHEALANVVRHAQARNARVHLQTNGDLLLTIVDDGKGLPANVRAGVGLNSMRERAEELGGAFHIVSTPGAGATIKVRLPLRGEET
jgi:two-component system, NarL family, sensor kinase